ncbi:hypothetical protein [Roseateles sp. LKC17W]|uniref:Uncharacterized protein n=1 Tax=Pelomonas margarita TaxID=3299031 RepID=A0ABW7FJD3_9BURK
MVLVQLPGGWLGSEELWSYLLGVPADTDAQRVQAQQAYAQLAADG